MYIILVLLNQYLRVMQQFLSNIEVSIEDMFHDVVL